MDEEVPEKGGEVPGSEQGREDDGDFQTVKTPRTGTEKEPPRSQTHMGDPRHPCGTPEVQVKGCRPVVVVCRVSGHGVGPFVVRVVPRGIREERPPTRGFDRGDFDHRRRHSPKQTARRGHRLYTRTLGVSEKTTPLNEENTQALLRCPGPSSPSPARDVSLGGRRRNCFRLVVEAEVPTDTWEDRTP